MNRIEKKLVKIIEQLGDSDFDDKIEILNGLKTITESSVVSQIFEKEIEIHKNDFCECVDILQLYLIQNRQGLYKYLPYLNHIIFTSAESDFSLFKMAYIMKKNEADEEWTTLDENGDMYTLEEGIEATRVKAATTYYLTDKQNSEVISFL